MINSKTTLVFLLLLCFSFQNNISAQNQDNNEITDLGFTARKVADRIWLIDDQRNDNFYLVEGNEKALLIDAGIGAGDLKKFLGSLTKLPLVVVNTHAHHDHINGDFQFADVFIHPAEIEAAKKILTKEYRDAAAKRITQVNPKYDTKNILEVDNYQAPNLIPIEEGYVFDLGGRKLEIIETPGHTPGCICLLDRENKLLFSGDNNCQHIWLFMDNSTSVETYMKSLENLMTYSEYFDTIFPGHLEPMGKDYLNEVHTCVQNILSGNCEPKPYQSFGDNVRQCTFKRAIVVFNPEHIRNNK
jgi:hydroxyacylglutathione hydrolase